MNLDFPSPEYDDMVAALCHGTATEEEMRALSDLLRSNQEARDEYLMRVEVHSRLASEPDLFPQVTDAAALSRIPETGFSESCPVFDAKPGIQRSKRTRVRLLALAACFALIGAGTWSLWLRRVAAEKGTTSNAIAMLTRSVGARWGRSTQPLRPGSALGPERLRLESGLAQVVFYSGARVVMEGPAELQLVSPSEAFCPAGRLLAEVPGPARGFRLKTTQLDVVDFGTSFGIDAMHGRTELDVFKGKVEFSAGTRTNQPLDEGRAAVVQTGAAPQLMEASSAAFTLMFDLQERSLTSEAIRYDRWRVASARLGHDPSLVVHLDLEDLSDSDWTLRNAADMNQSVQDATIVGCHRAEGRWREKQALEFQSVNDRVRLAVPGNFESLTLGAWVRVQGLDRQFSSLFMCDGFEPGAIHWLMRNDGVLSLTVKGPGSRNSEIVASPPVLTLDRFGLWTHLAVVIDGKTRKVVHYVNGLPVASHTLRLGPPFRIGSAELGNWNAKSGPNPAPSLIRNLSGSLDEFELFSRALTDAEVHDLYMEGKPQLDP
jgi:concanavalin A-like lectin/glucanase superfamily protein